MDTAPQLLDKINAHIEKLQQPRIPEGLYEPIRYVLSIGGKRIRPVLMLMAYNLYKEDVSEILSQAVGIETYHNYTLLHDDLMDRAELRRNKPTVHMKWNDNTAILSGDAMLVLAYEYISHIPPTQIKDVLEVFSQTALEICEGQQYDMEFESRMNVTENEYIEMIRLKTAVLLSGSLKIGAILGGATNKDIELLYDFGIQMGLAFQLQDDFLDVYGDSKVFGKNIGGDILCNKKTYLLIKALEQADNSQRKELEKWLLCDTFEPTEKIQAVTELYNIIGIKSLCENKMKQCYEKGIDCLLKINVPDNRKSILKSFAEDLMYRKM